MEEFRNNEENLNDQNYVVEESVHQGFVNLEEKKVVLNNNTQKRNRFFPFVATGVISAMVGGLIMAGAVIYALPKNNTSQNTEGKQATTVSDTGSTSSAAGYLTSNSTKDLSIVEIAKKVSPAVVGITATSDATAEDPFGFSMDAGPSQGTGIIFSEDGYIVTNYHVIQGAKTIKITLNNGKEVNGKVVNYDEVNDLAVLKITDKTDIPGIAEFGDSSKLQVGELAVAIGDPLGKELYGSVTAGVVSALNRKITVENTNYTVIQTDAAINPGNSGGPLVNSKGQVIGINSAKIGGNGLEGLGFAIPINIVKPKIQELTKPLLTIGISGTEITSQLSKQYNLPIGIYVQNVTSFSAAERSGLQAGDVIVKFDGETVKTVSDLNKIKLKHKVGDSVKVAIVRNGLSKTLTLKFIEN